MKKKLPIKQELKKFYNKLLSEIKRREKYLLKKEENEKWVLSSFGAKYRWETDVLNELFDNMSQNVNEMDIEIKPRKY